MAPHSSILAWKIPQGGTWRATVHGVPKSRIQLSNFTFFSLINYFNIVTACNVSNIQLYLHFNDCKDSSMCQCQKDLLKVKIHISSMYQLLMHPTVQSAAAAKSLHSCLTLRDPMDCSPPGSSFHGILRARGLEWGAIAFSDSIEQ